MGEWNNKENIMIGYVIKKSATSYIVNCDPQGNGGYNVVPREIDPYNKYTLEEVRDYLLDNPEMLLDSSQIELETLEKQARSRRDALLKEVVDAVNPMRWEAMTELQKDAWRVYRQALLDIPQQDGFPTSITWPTKP